MAGAPLPPPPIEVVRVREKEKSIPHSLLLHFVNLAKQGNSPLLLLVTLALTFSWNSGMKLAQAMMLLILIPALIVPY